MQKEIWIIYVLNKINIFLFDFCDILFLLNRVFFASNDRLDLGYLKLIILLIIFQNCNWGRNFINLFGRKLSIMFDSLIIFTVLLSRYIQVNISLSQILFLTLNCIYCILNLFGLCFHLLVIFLRKLQSFCLEFADS